MRSWPRFAATVNPFSSQFTPNIRWYWTEREYIALHFASFIRYFRLFFEPFLLQSFSMPSIFPHTHSTTLHFTYFLSYGNFSSFSRKKSRFLRFRIFSIIFHFFYSWSTLSVHFSYFSHSEGEQWAPSFWAKRKKESLRFLLLSLPPHLIRMMNSFGAPELFVISKSLS